MVIREWGIRYAIHIVTVHFGSLCSKVCECLLRKGPLSLQDISRFAELEEDAVKNVLLVLTQHNCVQAFVIEEPGDITDEDNETFEGEITYEDNSFEDEIGIGRELEPVTKFMVIFDNILNRVRCIKFSKIIGDELGEQCGKVLHRLLQDGRQTLGQMMDRPEETPMAPDAVTDSLSKLVKAHYVERVPAPEPDLTKNTEDENASERRGHKSTKIMEEPENIEHRVLKAATLDDAMRFSLPESNSNSFVEGKDLNSSGMLSGVKCKQDDMVSKNESSEVVWRPNFEEFIRHLRHEACIETVKIHIDDEVAVVFRAMLAATRYEEKKVKTEISVPLSVTSIYEEAIKSEAVPDMTLERVKASLVELCTLPPNEPFVKMSENSDTYRIDFRRILAVAQKAEVESIVMRRYGEKALPMFRFLSSQKNRLIETNKIADTVLIERNEALKILFQMVTGNYLHMQYLKMKGTTTVSDFLLWKVDKLMLWRHVLDELFHASLNLSLRVVYELDQEKELLKLKQENLDAELKERKRRLIDKMIRLTASRFKLDDAIMLFHDF